MQQIQHALRKRRAIVLISSIVITAIYWFIALWYTDKSAYSKDLVVFHQLFDSFFVDKKWMDLWQYVYQFAVTVLLFWLTPFLLTKYCLKTGFSELGLKFVYDKQALQICAVAYTVVIASTYFSSQDPLIASEYPLSKLIGTSWSVFVVYQSVYVFYFIAYEIFYRGYLQFGLKSDKADTKEIIIIILIQTVLTTLFHIGKPTPEIISAAVFGPVFGYVVFRYNSIWYGLVIHFVMNVFLDLFSLYWLHQLPQKFF